MPEIPTDYAEQYKLFPNVDNCPNSKMSRRGGCYLQNIAYEDGSRTANEILTEALSTCNELEDCVVASCGYDDTICNGECFSCTLQMDHDPSMGHDEAHYYCDLRWAMLVIIFFPFMVFFYCFDSQQKT